MSDRQQENVNYVIQHQFPWARFSKDTGAKILCANNYEPNSGLGVDLQGRVAPVAHEKRTQYYSRRGLGFGLGLSTKSDASHKETKQKINQIKFVKPQESSGEEVITLGYWLCSLFKKNYSSLSSLLTHF